NRSKVSTISTSPQLPHWTRRIVRREADLVMGEQAAKVPPKKEKASSSNTQLTKTAACRRNPLQPQKK
uniref:Uncharacterized protein n=1 Tax=Triticum urartu TaxID=4572 RepID=A0A8R7R936_TRIUA